MGDDQAVLDAERRRYRLIQLGLLCALAVAALIQRDQRALLLSNNVDTDAVKAFTAILPNGIAVPGATLGIRRPRPRSAAVQGGRSVAPSAFVARVAPAAIPTEASAEFAPVAGFFPSEVAQVTSGGSSGGGPIVGLPSTGPFLQGPGPGGPGQTVTTPTDPVGAVPEPSSWMIMILGIGGIGCLMRRRRDRGAAPDHDGRNIVDAAASR